MKKDPCAHDTRAFTLIELLVVVAIIAVIAAIALPVLSGTRKRALLAAEIAAAKSVTAGLQMYSAENNGAVLPGFYTPPSGQVADKDGNTIGGQEAKRYPWRLAPYLGFDVKKAFLASGQKIQNPGELNYMVSLVPSLGMNTQWVGGDDRKSTHPFNPRAARRFFENGGVTRMSQVLSPSRMIAFISATYNDSRMGGRQPGYFSVEYPAVNVDFRHAKDKALVVFLDGHTELLGRDELQNDRLWKNLPEASSVASR
jgi:prepilin-type N-terminal cleavage/methylation domain-containing protein